MQATAVRASKRFMRFLLGDKAGFNTRFFAAKVRTVGH